MAIELPVGMLLTYGVKILIYSVILYLSVRWVGGQYSFAKSLLLMILMEVFSSTAPIVLGGLIYFVLSIVIWLVLAMGFFKLSFSKAILVWIVQYIVGFILAMIGAVSILIALVTSML
jgi:hypothetical protein